MEGCGLIKDELRFVLRLHQIRSMRCRPDVQWFLDNLVPPTEVLDLCGGWGLWMLMLKRMGYQFSYVCVDMDPGVCSEGVRLSHRLGLRGNQFISSDVNDTIPLRKQGFDQVWLFGWYPANPKQYLFDQIRGLLAPGGRLYCSFREQDVHWFDDFTIEKTVFIEGYGKRPFDFYVAVMRDKK